MSSDVMIVCKEFKNDYRSVYDKLWDFKGDRNGEEYQKISNDIENYPNKAVFIDEASMGEPWTEFGKWFVDKYYNGYSMLEIVTSIMNGTQKDIDEMHSTIFDNPINEFDYDVICNAMDKMTCHPDLDKQKVKDYLKKCIGKSISTENW